MAETNLHSSFIQAKIAKHRAAVFGFFAYLMLTFAGMDVLAQFAGGDGSSGAPYQINSAEGLDAIRDNLSAHYILTADIDLTNATRDGGAYWNGGDGWEPIGTNTTRFTGSLNGDGHSITGLFIDRNDENSIGLFGWVGSGVELRNISMVAVDLTGDRYIGGLVGVSIGKVMNSFASGSVNGSFVVGGLVGRNFNGTITGSYATANVDISGNTAGGLVGSNEGSISNSHATGSVNGVFNISGLVGTNGGSISNTYATGNVSGTGFIGGLVGSIESGNTITNSYWNTETSGTNTGVGEGDASGTTGLTSAEMRQEASFTDFDFDDTWQIQENLSFPVLRDNNPDTAPGFIFEEGEGNESTPYEIGTAEQLNAIRYNSDAHYILTADIDLTTATGDASGAFWDEGKGWEPIGTNNNRFTGALNGDRFTITGLFINRPGGAFTGLFGGTDSGSEITNLGLEEVNITAGTHVGGLVGLNYGMITSSYTTGRVSGSNLQIGGLAGTNFGTITESFSICSVAGVTGSGRVGGLVGSNEDTITNSYATGDVTGSSGIGGLVGRNGDKINNSYATGKVNGSKRGGLVGDGQFGTITTSYWNTETSGTITGIGDGSSSGVTGLTSAEMRQQASFTGFDFTGTWQIEEGIAFPVLRNNTPDSAPGFIFEEGDGNESTPYEIGTAAQLNAIRYILDANYILTANIDLTNATRDGGAYWNGGDGWEPIGTYANQFTGSLDGDGHTITGMFIDRDDEDYIGLFGHVDSNGSLNGVGLEEADVTGKNSVGILAGGSRGAISGSYATGEVIGDQRAGGLMGWVLNGATITSSYATVSVSGTGDVGGLAGNIISSTINGSYATGSVNGTTNVGGLVGWGQESTIENSYAMGSVSGINSAFGGLVGFNFPGSTITKSYWNTETSGQGAGVGDGDAGETTGLTNAEMRQEASFAGFDFDDTWQIESGTYSSYPYLQGITYDEPGTEPEVNPIPGLFTYSPDGNNILYVDQNADGDGSGNSWVNAIPELRDVLDWAQDRDGESDDILQIWVAEGVYLPTDGTDRAVSFKMINHVEIYGGFAGGEDPNSFNLADRDFEANETVLSGDIGVEENDSDNAYHVFYHHPDNGTNLDNSAILDGVIISGGRANREGTDLLGAGMYNKDNSPSLSNVIFKDNIAFDGNSSGISNGGGIYNENSSPVLKNVVFTGNEARYGGAMSNRSGSSPTLTNVTISSNKGNNAGSGIYNNQSNPVLINVLITGNDDNGGILNYASSPDLRNVTISGNSGRGMDNTGGSYPILKNSIVWGNSGGDVHDRSGGPFGTNSTTIEHSIVGGVDDPDNGNIDEDPLFINPISSGSAPTTAGDYRLQGSSPAINAGDNDALPESIATDMEGNPRFDADIADMGAYEFQGASLPAVTTDTEINNITSSSADLAGEVTNNGNIEITGRGFVWSVQEEPDLTANVVTSGSGMAVFNETLSDLPPASQIYVRAYATNRVGTAYGAQVSFNTDLAELTLTGSFSVLNKEYDGALNADFDSNNLSLTGVYGDHEVSLENVSIQFAQSDAGTNLAVSIDGADLTGEDAGKYTLSLVDAPTAAADIEPISLTLAAGDQSKVYGEDDPALSYQVSTGSLVGADAFTGTISREEGEDTGTYQIGQGDLSAGGNYAITFETGELSITPKTLEIVADAQTKTYGEDDPELTFSTNGWAFDDDGTNLTGSLEREEGESAGEYTINQGDLSAGDNYSIDYTEAVLKIEGGVLTITADSQSKTYGEEDPEWTYAVSGFASGDDASVLSGSLTREEGEDTGTYQIGQGDLSAGGNYAITFEPGELSITPKTLEIVADAQTKTYGEDDPELTFSTNGWALDDDSSNLTGSLDREEGESSGEYVINQGNLSAGDNYSIDYTEAVLTIEGGVLTIVADSQSKTYGESDPELTYSVSGFAGGDDASILSGSLSREEGEDADTYQIGQGDLSAGENYTITFETGELFITPNTLEVVADEGLTKIAGEDDPVLTFNVSGFVFDDDESLLTGSLDREDGESPGNYAIRLGNLSAGPNYEINFTENIFSVLRTAPVVISRLPEDGAELIPVNTSIQLEFDQPVEIVNNEGIRLENSNSETIIVRPEVQDDNILVIAHDGLQYFMEYEVTVEAGALANIDGIINGEISWGFTTIIQAPRQVKLLSPADSTGSVSAESISLTWEEEINSGSYQVVVSEDENFESILFEDLNVQQTSLSFNELEFNQAYYWRVRAVNENSEGPWSETAVFATRLQNPEPLFPVDGAREISIAPELEWESNLEAGTYHIELSLSPDFEESVEFQSSSSTYYEVSGLEANQTYHWRTQISDSLAGIFTESEWSNILSFTTRPDPSDSNTEPVSISFEFGNGANGESSQQDYRLLGLPGNDGLRINEIFDDPYNDSWRAFYDTGSEIDFLAEYTPEDSRFTFNPGLGFWILSIDPVMFNQALSAVEVDENDQYGFSIHPGWNIISNPFQKNISWDDIQVINEISADLYSFDGGYALSDSLKAFTGYYFYNDPAWGKETLYIPYSDMEQKSMRQLKPEEEKEAQIMALEIEFERKSSSRVEFTSGSNQAKVQTFSKPHPGLEFAHSGAVVSDLVDDDTRNVFRRAVTDENSSKKLQVKAPAGSTSTWSFMPDDESPNGAVQAILAINTATNKTILIEEGQSREIHFTEPLSIYEIYVGGLATLKEMQSDLMPKTFELSQNYPNPFNPATNIRYSVPERTEVRLEIYDLLGRKVQTLVNETQSAGWHMIRWNASSLASGMYLYRLQAGNQTFTKKLTLIK